MKLPLVFTNGLPVVQSILNSTVIEAIFALVLVPNSDSRLARKQPANDAEICSPL